MPTNDQRTPTEAVAVPTTANAAQRPNARRGQGATSANQASFTVSKPWISSRRRVAGLRDMANLLVGGDDAREFLEPVLDHVDLCPSD